MVRDKKKVRVKGKLVQPKSFKDKEKRVQKNRSLSAKDPARAELRGKSLREDPKFAADVAGKAQEADVRETAKRSVDIETEKGRLRGAADSRIGESTVGEESKVVDVDPRGTFEKGRNIIEQVGNVIGGRDLEIGDRTFKTGFGEEVERGELRAGTVPLGPSGNIAGFMSEQIGVGGKAGTAIFDSILKGRELLLTPTGKLAVGSIVGGSAIMNWMATDNIIGSMEILSRDITNEVRFGGLTPDEGLAKLDEATTFVNDARVFMNKNSQINPVLWPFRGIIMTKLDSSQLFLDTARETMLRA